MHEDDTEGRGDRDIASFLAGRAAEIWHFESSFTTLNWETKGPPRWRGVPWRSWCPIGVVH